MAIVAKSVLEARRAAAREAAAAAQDNPGSSRQEASPTCGQHAAAQELDSHTIGTELPPEQKPAKRRGHATKDDRGKWQPTSDYPHGFARTPEHSRFKRGCKGGPGRPKGSVSHDALMAKHLNQKREVSLNGRRRQVANRELVIMSTVKSAIEGKDKQARAHVLAHDQRLHPSKEGGEDALGAPALSASDMLSLAEYEAELRERIRAEIRAELEAEKGRAR
jgi:hypothetical protein